MSFEHVSVMLEETVTSVLPDNDYINSNNEFTFVDCTLGGGGHSKRFMELFTHKFSDVKLKMIGIDRDIEALTYATSLINNNIKNNVEFYPYHNSFDNIYEINDKFNITNKIDAIIADLGVSSPQLDKGERGFSIRNNGPVDMRMNREDKLSAKDIIEQYTKEQLTKIFFDYGEEPRSFKLATQICSDRLTGKIPLHSTVEFAEYIKRVLAYPPNSKVHPATRAFQALRIEVNRELECISKLLTIVPQIINPNGKLGVITFHSLEDRIVKQTMREWEEMENITASEVKKGLGKEIPRGGITAPDEECSTNRRARSARLRVFEFGKERKRKKKY